MNSIKVKVIVNWTTSINLKEVQSFVKFVNFYRRFIKNFSKLVKSFTQLTRKNTSFVWNKVCVQAFDDLKKQISSISVLRHFDSKRQTILAIESEVDLYQRVKDVNRTNELCNKYRQAISENKLKLHSTKLKHCEIINDVLFRKDLLWVSENMHTKLLKKIHDQSFIFHSDNQRTIDLVQRFYY